MAKDEGHGFFKKANSDYQFYATVEFVKEFLLQIASAAMFVMELSGKEGLCRGRLSKDLLRRNTTCNSAQASHCQSNWQRADIPHRIFQGVFMNCILVTP